MHWIAPSEKDTGNGTLEKRLWDAADQFCANSGLKSQEYSAPVLGLIFPRFAEDLRPSRPPVGAWRSCAAILAESCSPLPLHRKAAPPSMMKAWE